MAKSNNNEAIKKLTEGDYKYGFVTDVETETVPPGLNEDVIRLISSKKSEPEFLLKWRLKAHRNRSWSRRLTSPARGDKRAMHCLLADRRRRCHNSGKSGNRRKPVTGR